MLYSAVFLKLRAISILHMLHIRRHEYIPMRAGLMLLLISVVLPVGCDKYLLFLAFDTCDSYIRFLQF